MLEQTHILGCLGWLGLFHLADFKPSFVMEVFDSSFLTF